MGAGTSNMIEELKQFPSQEKLQVINELWQSIPQEDIPIDETVLDEMDRRFEAYLRDPERAKSWSEVESRVMKNLACSA